MKENRQQLATRVEVLESILRTSLLKNLRVQFVMECEKNVNLKKTLAEETTEKQRWEDCAERLMKENQQLRHGIPPTEFETMLKNKIAALEKKLGESPFCTPPPPSLIDPLPGLRRATPLSRLRDRLSWRWRKLFNHV